ncbi:hypothetical protein RHMOL_Rhmol04G0100300 [Rhododendron molle]|uniref:Uncharacterized protein n=2 Tax=Rhododendron molle TaxID=49168 RepID=A0ACC0P024_RHOML|nr:hypothetical protein RHMOL_Rhmol04G0100300 [Rhododendron molle]KAI8558515.1 hypothetical protein RHMOL_Rhmol04G0100300 [Rhododendron molle]
MGKGVGDEGNSGASATVSVEIEFFSKIPPELSHRILKFLFSEVFSLSTIYFLSLFATLFYTIMFVFFGFGSEKRKNQAKKQGSTTGNLHKDYLDRKITFGSFY